MLRSLTPPDNALAAFRQTLDVGGIAAGLQFLNARVEYRCSAIYRLENLTMHNVATYDRTGATSNSLLAVPLSDSFCQHVIRDGSFVTDDSSTDPRLAGHPYSGVVVSYYGLPLTRVPGEIYGTFCHFDYVERTVPDSEIAFLEKAARLLPTYI